MSSLAHFFEFFEQLKNIPDGVHLGEHLDECIRSRSPDNPMSFESFVLPTESLGICARLRINGIPNPIEGHILLLEVNLEKAMLTIRLSSDNDREIPFEDLISMEEIPHEQLHSKPETRNQARGPGTCCPHTADARPDNRI